MSIPGYTYIIINIIARYSNRSGISAGGFSIATNIILGIASAASFTSFAVSLIIVQIAFLFCDFRPGPFFCDVRSCPFFLPMRSKRIFRALVLKKFGDVNLPTRFCKSQIACLNINRKKAILQGIAFFWRFLFPSHFCAFCLVVSPHVSNATVLHFFRCGHLSIEFSKVLE